MRALQEDRLKEYARRRDFGRTPEPLPQSTEEAHASLRFVVQAHAARAMHYDFRLQVGEALVSWAIPKGPSLNPKDRRLAMHTEDHPLEYASFEGVIPQGQYGGGSVIVWDEGTWEPEGDPNAALKQGKLHFTLHGKKLTGRFHLMRMRKPAHSHKTHNANGSSWLLIKSRDASAQSAKTSIVKLSPESVLSGRTLKQVEQAPSAVWQSKETQKEVEQHRTRPDPSVLPGAHQAHFPSQRKPQLATLVSEAPQEETERYVYVRDALLPKS